jgi:1-acyl-sn-glycerol-3-phosphate acyltransferase
LTVRRIRRDRLLANGDIVCQLVTVPPPAHRLAHVKPLRLLWQFSAFVAITLLLAPLVMLGGIVHRRRFVPPLLRAWGRSLLACAGVRLVLEPAVRAELARSRRRVLTLNHASTLDMFVVTAFWPDGGVIVMKREFLAMPVFGWVVRCMDAVPIDRANRESAAAALRTAAAFVRAHDRTIIVAPEGTRSRSGELQRFKLGAFHIAQAAEAPIVPLVLHGTRELWPMDQLHCSPGTVTVRVLPEMAPPKRGDDVHSIAAILHAEYSEALEAMRREVPTA